MKFLTISEILLIIAVPFLVFLVMLNFYGFDNNFYREKFLEYGVSHNVPNSGSLHEKVINFIKGESNELPNEFNERERQHLLDVRKIIRAAAILLYAAAFLFIFLLIFSSLKLKSSSCIMGFTGKALFLGGILTIILAAAAFFMISFGFSSTFESFHQLLFQKGTYLFDPANEMIVNLYPEQLFRDIGARVSKGVILSSALVILLGIILSFMSKSKKNKKKG